jgi:hypothetical protein
MASKHVKRALGAITSAWVLPVMTLVVLGPLMVYVAYANPCGSCSAAGAAAAAGSDDNNANYRWFYPLVSRLASAVVLRHVVVVKADWIIEASREHRDRIGRKLEVADPMGALPEMVTICMHPLYASFK